MLPVTTATPSIERRGTQRPRLRRSVAFVGTYPPTRCGIATFTFALRRALGDERSGVVALVDDAGRLPRRDEVVAELVRGSSASLSNALLALSAFDVVVVQHEFGIYGGSDGEDVVDLVRRLSRPSVVVLHTVLQQPTLRQRAIVERLVGASSATVVLSRVAERRLLEVHDVDPGRVHVIPHGAPPALAPAPGRVGAGAPTILTWGLLGPSKGIELGIEALDLLGDVSPAPTYVVLGGTHPRVVEREGERYRAFLADQARARGLADRVRLDDGYLDHLDLLRAIGAADVVLLPYRSREQVVSGVLVEALAAGVPVVATAFPHAVELLGAGSGVVVPHDDPLAIAGALRGLLAAPERAAAARAAAARQGPAFLWPIVAASYRSLIAEVAHAQGARASR